MFLPNRSGTAIGTFGGSLKDVSAPDLGATATPMTIAEFAKLVADETEKWAKVIRVANIKVE